LALYASIFLIIKRERISATIALPLSYNNNIKHFYCIKNMKNNNDTNIPLAIKDITIRPATKEDCPRMMELINELAAYEKAPQEVTVNFNHFVESGFGSNPIWWAFVAETNGTILGFALYYIRYSTWKGQRMYLEDIIVTQESRGKGIGNLLMNTLIEEAKAKNFSGMLWQVLDWNEPAIHFYKKYNANFDGEWINCSLNFDK
jgi:L-amino acid N-acyltransferase YncA